MRIEDRVRPPEEKQPSNGEWLMRTLKPLGCVLVLLIAAAVLVVCFTAGRDPIKGYQAPQTSEYYAQHLGELQTELEANVFPQLQGVEGSEVTDGTLAVTIAHRSFAPTRSAILRYYDASLFEFIDAGS